jgi:hypothetical protein
MNLTIGKKVYSVGREFNMHKLDVTKTMYIHGLKEDPKYQIFGWESIGYSTEHVGTKKSTDYGYDSLTNTVVSRETEREISANYLHYYRILEENIRDEIITLERDYNEQIKEHKYTGKYVSWFFYFIKIFLPVSLACMFIFAYIPNVIIGMNTDPNLIDNNNETILGILIFVGFFMGVLITALLTYREDKKANLTNNLKYLKKHKSFKLIITKAKDLLKTNNNDSISFDPKDDIIFNRNFLSLKAFQREDKGLIIPSGISEVKSLNLNPNNYLYVYIPKDVEVFPYVWFANTKNSNYYQDGKTIYTTYKDRFILYEGSEKMYGYPDEVSSIYTYYFGVQKEDIGNIIARASIKI